MPDTDKPKNRVIRFFSNPLVGGLGTIIGLISILLAIYFYLDQRQFRKLTYYVHPVKAAIVKAGQVSQLTAIYADKPIKTDITAAQVAFWNQGKLAIKDNDILKSIVLYTGDKTPILEATIRKVSRDVIKLQLQTQEARNGRVTISWQILEQNDGGVIQLIYAGSPDVDIRFSGVIEGQKEIEQIVYKEKIMSPDEQYRAAGVAWGWTTLLIPGFFLILIFIKNLILHKTLLVANDYFILILLAIFVGMIYFFRIRIPGPPFGF